MPSWRRRCTVPTLIPERQERQSSLGNVNGRKPLQTSGTRFLEYIQCIAKQTVNFDTNRRCGTQPERNGDTVASAARMIRYG